MVVSSLILLNQRKVAIRLMKIREVLRTGTRAQLSVVANLPDFSEGQPSNKILIARRALEGIKSIELIDDLIWDSLYKKWVLLCRLTPDVKENEHVPIKTAWYVHIPPTYPWGEIKFFPAKDKGIKVTFPHQNYNGVGEKEVPWSNGSLCLDTSTKVLGREGYDFEPFETETQQRVYPERAWDAGTLYFLPELMMFG